MVDELRRSYHDRLSEVHALVAGMVSSASGSASAATTALLEGKVTDAELVAATSDTLAAENVCVEREGLDLLALQGPVARDLRLLMASLRVAHEAELSGSLASSVAARAGRLDARVLTSTLRTLLYDQSAEAAELLKRAGQAFAVLDDGLACAVLESDPTVRRSHRRLLAELFKLHDAPVEAAVELGVIARCYERISDHAVEIALRVRFVVSAGTLLGG